MIDELDEIRDPNELSETELGEVMDLVPLIKTWCTDIQNRVEKLVLDGHQVIGVDGLPYKMVAGRGSRNWIDVDAAEKSMRNYKVKVSDMFISKFVSPPQAEKILGKDHPIMKKHVIMTQGKPSLVPGSDKRQAFQASGDEMESYDDDS